LKNPSQKRAGGMTQGIGPEFKYHTHKKNKIMSFAEKWMELEIIIVLSEISQIQKDKYRIFSLKI
jgi:hypothetical protein